MTTVYQNEETRTTQEVGQDAHRFCLALTGTDMGTTDEWQERITTAYLIANGCRIGPDYLNHIESGFPRNA